MVIAGGGPAGLTAGMYAARAGLKTLLVEKQVLGGQVTTTELVENYPGFPEGISGFDLTSRMEKQAKKFGVETEFFEIISLKSKGDLRQVKGKDQEFFGKAAIVATGAHPHKLGVPGEEKYKGRGVSYCATCDGALFKGGKVLVVGGGDSAVEEAVFLTRYVEEVTVVHRRDELRATKALRDRAFKNSKISFVWDSHLLRIEGDSKVQRAVLRNKKSGEEKKLAVEGVFIYVGNRPNVDFAKDFLKLDDKGYIITNDLLEASVKGIFAAGDVRRSPLKQIVVAASEGALAAYSTQRYIEENFGAEAKVTR